MANSCSKRELRVPRSVPGRKSVDGRTESWLSGIIVGAFEALADGASTESACRNAKMAM